MISITPLLNEPIGTISPRIYGHFAEHLGRCCYDGLWVGPDSTIPNRRGFRSDVVDALKGMPTPMLRWPGGCYADHYHWRDGIGPSEKRPRRLGLSCGLTTEDDNSLGTHEFMDFCRMIGAEPYFAGNMGSGSVQEMCDWVEYCNANQATDLANERRKNGDESPFGIKLWGVGNENWGCGGNYNAETYGMEFRRYATMLKHVDSTLELVACGFDSAWNRKFMELVKGHLELIDHLSVHKYWTRGGPGASFDEEQYYRLLEEADSTEAFIVETHDIISGVCACKTIGVALDEYGVWHPEARSWGDNANRISNDYSQPYTLRDAIAVAVAMEGFHRQCKILSMANLAQIVNVLHAPIATQGAAMWVTPTYHVLQLHAAHVGATALPVKVDSHRLPAGGPAVTATASTKEGQVAITITNRHLREAADVGIYAGGQVQDAKLLTGESAFDENTAEAPAHVSLRDMDLVTATGKVEFSLPPHSVATIIVG
jgi:alpha-N-arabinofuranosidase